MNESNKVSLLSQLTDDELNIVAGGARTNADNPGVKACLDAFYKSGGMECVTSSSGKSVVCF